MEIRTTGTVVSVKKQWWLKVNTKPVRLHAMDGAIFPHIVKVKYIACGKEIIKSKWLKASITPPSQNQEVTVIYREDKPTKFRLEI